jgi:hypothetical protein
MSDRQAQPDPTPRWDQVAGKQWGQTVQPVQEPAAKPRGARTGMLVLLGLLALVVIAALVIALIRS